MAKNQLPVYSIRTIKGFESSTEEYMVSPFGEYLSEREYLLKPHGHSFYHFVFFTKGAGKQCIDFAIFPIMPGQIYFMRPGQVHNWRFSGEAEGYVVNFSDSFFNSLLIGIQYEQFSFFGGYVEDQVIQLTEEGQREIKELFDRLLIEIKSVEKHTQNMIRTLLLQLLISVSRKIEPGKVYQLAKSGYKVVRNFQKLINTNYARLRLPSEYAALLHVTPNYLNSICKGLLGKSSGEVIRGRVILEAKRMLVYGDMSISEIANQLNFPDNSYFTKFFKKLTGMPPEKFRKEHQINFNK
jgi:AraC family transcriptional activator of pobA